MSTQVTVSPPPQRPRLLSCAALLAGLAMTWMPSSAQVDDEQTRDYEEQDRRYQQRHLEQRDRDAAAPQPPDAEAVRRFLDRAEELVRDQNYWSRSSEHYVLQTDDPNLESNAVLELLEAFYAFFGDQLGSLTELRDTAAPSRVFLYDSFYKYNQLLGFDARFSEIRPKGHYLSGFNVMVLHTTASSPASLADSLVHEAAHQLISRRLYPEGAQPSLWVTEGLASYFGFTHRDAAGAFHAGEIGGKSVAVMRGVKSPKHREGAARLKQFRQWFRSAERQAGALIDGLVRTRDPASFYGEHTILNYTASWLLVHFLLHGEQGRHAAPFLRYVSHEAEQGPDPAQLYRELALDAAQLEAAVRAHARRLKLE